MSPRAWRLAVLSTAVLTLGAAPAVADLAPADPTSATGASTPAADRPTADPTSPANNWRTTRVLPEKMSGRGAVKTLGPDLAAVAARNDVTGPRLKKLLLEDHSAWLSVEGQLFYQEDAPAEATTQSGLTALAALAPAYPTAQTFTLHSRAGAARTVFLDFDGAMVVDTGWNTGDRAMANATHIGYDSDGNPMTFTSTEHAFVQAVWREVAESYAPFDVDVTTQDPGPAGYTRSASSDATYGTHVVVTSSKVAKDEACGTCLGLAWVGSFDSVDPNGVYQPAWVFADSPQLTPTVIAQAATHETGHTLGLHHDGTTTTAYYAGTAAWGPIMGSSRTRAVSQFSIGEYAGANNTENDVAIIQSNGLPLRPDDHGSSTSTPDQLGVRASYDVRGVIGTRSDTDVFAISLPCTTSLKVSATGIGAQTALDLSLAVVDGAGRTVAVNSPSSTYAGSPPVSSGMNAQVSVPSATGTYYLRVDGVGQGNPGTTGWSDYGSLGQYRLTATGCSAATTSTPSSTPTSTPTTTPTTAPTTSPATTTPTTSPTTTRPAAPVIKVASSGTRGRPITALARWSAPARTGGAAVTKYRVRALRLDKRNHVVAKYGSAYLSPTARALTMRLPKGRYTFSVMAWNRVGASGWSRSSGIVRAR
jgi:hypothetical protein